MLFTEYEFMLSDGEYIAEYIPDRAREVNPYRVR